MAQFEEEVKEPTVEKVIPRVEHIRNMTQDEIEESLNKDWSAKAGPTAEEISKRSNIKLKIIKNLRQYSDKPQDPEKKAISLQNLTSKTLNDVKPVDEFPETVRNTNLLKNILTPDEQMYFIDRWNEYYQIFGQDLNTGPDYDNMMELVMCYIDLYRLQKKKKSSTNMQTDVGIDKIQHNVHTRIQNLLTTLKTRRRDRVESSERKENKIMELIIAKTKQADKFFALSEGKLSQEMIEEKKALKSKMDRGDYVDG